MISAYDPRVIATLETLLSPGGRSRISPYVESAQFRVLFDQAPDPHNRVRSIEAILSGQQETFIRLAREWEQFAIGSKRFGENDYCGDAFLCAYLAYYSTVNVTKVQFCLLELVRKQLLSGILHIADVGVGTGTTLLGVLDFLLSWATVCQLYGTALPVEEVAFTGFDRSLGSLTFATRAAEAYAAALDERRALLLGPGNDAIGTPLEKIAAWARTTQWQQHDINVEELDCQPFNLVFASNILNELSKTGATHLQSTLGTMPNGGLVIVIEPGAATEARALMRWRRKFLMQYPHVLPIAPCGSGPGTMLSIACDECWNARRESIHLPPLYTEFRSNVSRLASDARSYDAYENKLLSWSYTIFQSGIATTEDKTAPIVVSDSSAWPEEQPLLFIGSYIKKSDIGYVGPSHANPDLVKLPSNQTWVEQLKFCPSVVKGANHLGIERVPGIEIPLLHYGDLVSICNAFVLQAHLGVPWISHETETRISLVEDVCSTESVQRAFLPEYSDSSRMAVDEISYRLFGFPSLRSFQHQIIGRVLTGGNILGIAATGGGKSECFILPAMLLSGITIVISPLRSLMADQYEERICKRYGLDYLTTIINGDVPFGEREARLRRMELGYYKLVYLTPEQLERPNVLHSLQRAHKHVGIRFLALDEAHCISQWGHDFRPAYLNLFQRLRDNGINVARIALTATASPKVRHDICEELDLHPEPIEHGGDVFVESSNRPELNLVVRICETQDEKTDGILQALRSLPPAQGREDDPAAIVFVPWTGGSVNRLASKSFAIDEGRRSPRAAEFAAYLERELQERVCLYHSKMDAANDEETDEDQAGISQANQVLGVMTGRTRRGEQSAFMRGQRRIMVATKGFGMGIDKPTIRVVVHRTAPANLEAYAQEAGRAGRDGKLSTVILYYCPRPANKEEDWESDYSIQQRFLSDKYIRREDVLVMRALLGQFGIQLGGRIYLTNHDAIAFFHDCVENPAKAGLREPYAWPEEMQYTPKTQNRQSLKTDQDDQFNEIRSRGFKFSDKTKYIERILSVLYRIRPTVPEIGTKLPFINRVDTCSASVATVGKCATHEIFRSNAYFGKLLRTTPDLTPTEFERLLRSGALMELAARLNLSISETGRLLSDIRFSAVSLDRNGRLRSNLLQYNLEVPGYEPQTGTTLKDWWDYIGADCAKPDDARARATRSHRTRPDLEDWFSMKDVDALRKVRVGWEITPGVAFFGDDTFDAYLNAFMDIHDERERMDWDSYHRMLSDYIGVNTNGTQRKSDHEQCLRSVMLGYLKSNEVVLDGKCYSCNRCVPDERFEEYTEQRKRAVVRMSQAMVDLLDLAEASAQILPSADLLANIIKTLQARNEQSQGLIAYVRGWTNRLLQDTPGHLTALCIRARAMISDLFELQFEDLASLLPIIQRAAHAVKWDPVYEHIYRLLELGWLALEPRNSDMRMRFECHASLSDIYTFALRNGDKHRTHRLEAARHAPDNTTAEQWYDAVVRDWSLGQVQTELEELARRRRSTLSSALIPTWLQGNSERVQQVLELMNTDREWKNWSRSDLEQLFAQCAQHTLNAYPDVALSVLSRVEQPATLIKLATAVLQGGRQLSSEQIAYVAQSAVACDDAVTRVTAYKVLQAVYNPLQWTDIVCWIEWFPLEIQSETPATYLPFWLQALELLPTVLTRETVLHHLSPKRLMCDSATAGQAHAAWADVCIDRPPLAARYLLLCERVPEGRGYADHFLARLRSQGTVADVYMAALRVKSPTPPSMSLLFERFAPEVAAESLSDKLLILQNWAPKFAQHADHEVLLPILWTIAQSLLDDEEVGSKARVIWINTCVMSVQATRCYLEACLAPAPQLNQMTLLLTRLPAKQDPRATAYVYLKQVLAIGDLLTLEFWIASFAAELADEPITVQIDMILGWVESLEDTDLPAALAALRSVTQRLFVAGPSAPAAHREHIDSFGTNLRRACLYLVLAELAPDGDDYTQMVLDQFPDQRLRSGAYAITRSLQKFERWEPFANWLSRHSIEISAELGEVQLEFLEQGVILRRSDLDRVSTRTLLRPLFSAAVRDNVSASRAQELWMDVYLGDPDAIEEYLMHCDESGDEHLVIAYTQRSLTSCPHVRVPLFRALRKRFRSATWEEFARFITVFANEILTEPVMSQFDLFHQGAVLLPEGGQRSEAILVLEPLGHRLLCNSKEIEAVHKIWRNLCLNDSHALVRYVVVCEGLADGFQRIVELFTLLRSTNPDQAIDVALRRAQIQLPYGWEVLGPWLTQFAPEIAAFPDIDALSLLHHSIQHLPKDKTLEDALPIVWPLARTLLGRVNTQSEAHALWRQTCMHSRASLTVYVDYLNQVTEREQLVDELLHNLLNARQVALLAGMSDRAPSARMKMAVLMIDKLITFTGISGFNPKAGITKEDCPALAQQFSYQRDPEQADMLVAALGQLRTWSTPTFLTPLSRQIEAAVHAGQFNLARVLAANTPMITVGKERISVDEYVQRVQMKVRPRNGHISADYINIAKQILGQGRYPTYPLS